jgi:REP element-mobilizing transposase RayT
MFHILPLHLKANIMASTYSNIYLHLVFAVKNRKALLGKSWRQEVFKYIHGLIEGKGQRPVIVNGVSLHVHILTGISPNCCTADLARDIKVASTKFINLKKFTPEYFSWQEGYGVFSVSNTHRKHLYKYIAEQETHHAQTSFKTEYLALLHKMDIQYEEQYLFEWLDERIDV